MRKFIFFSYVEKNGLNQNRETLPYKVILCDIKKSVVISL